MENAVAVRDRLVAYQDDLRGQLRPDRRRRDRFVTEAGGGVLAAGIDGSITGFGAGGGGGVVLDDPFKNWQQAHSQARRDYVENQFKGTIRNRLDEEDAWIIIVHHRVHEDDLTARLLQDTADDSGDSWEHISLPALAVDNDPLGRAPGEALEPQRFDREQCLARARGMGSYLASGLEQQNPTPEEGNELLRAWFVLAESSELPRRPERAITSWDLKLKNREAGDYVVGQCWWKVGPAFWLVDQLRGRYDHATTANAIALLAVRHPEAKQHVIEAAGSSDEVIPQLRKSIEGYEVTDEMAARLGMNDQERVAVQELRRAGMGHLAAEPATDGSKPVRARNYIAPKAEAGFVRLPADAVWVPELLDEIAAFPEGTHDDQVDAMSQALKRLARSTARGVSAADVQLPR
jgi:predicted phage terminase large subunit-like protein